MPALLDDVAITAANPAYHFEGTLSRKTGRGILLAMPWLPRVPALVGTAAMI